MVPLTFNTYSKHSHYVAFAIPTAIPISMATAPKVCMQKCATSKCARPQWSHYAEQQRVASYHLYGIALAAKYRNRRRLKPKPLRLMAVDGGMWAVQGPCTRPTLLPVQSVFVTPKPILLTRLHRCINGFVRLLKASSVSMVPRACMHGSPPLHIAFLTSSLHNVRYPASHLR